MNYSEMSDVEIALTVGKLISFDGLSCIGVSGKAHIHDWRDGICIGWKEFDPCNSWEDAGPIIEKESISLTCHPSRGFWAAIFNRKCMEQHGNPLRAAMIVFLMKQEGE